MLATRDQENLVHAHQTTAAGKPLNQGVRALQPKTPGQFKTPFRGARNDENKPLLFNGPKTGGDGKLDKATFVTPAGPKLRAPLGLKTTNAKAQAFKTPGQPRQTEQPEKTARRPSTGRRSAKAKIAVAPAQPVEIDVLETEDDYVPEIEYAPPLPIELPDPPIEFGYDQTFPQFQGMNMMRGYGEVYGSPKDDNGMSVRVKEEEEQWSRFEAEVDRQILKSVVDSQDPREEDAALERHVDAMIAAGPKKKHIERSKVNTLKAKSAAAALSYSQLPAAAMKPTASSMQKKKKPAFAVLGSKSLPEPANPSPMRHTAAVALSKNTIGRPKAKQAPSIIPKGEQRVSATSNSNPRLKTGQSNIHPQTFRELYGEPPVESDMWFRLREHELLEDKLRGAEQDDLADDLFETDFFPTGSEEDDQIFQLPIPDSIS